MLLHECRFYAHRLFVMCVEGAEAADGSVCLISMCSQSKPFLNSRRTDTLSSLSTTGIQQSVVITQTFPRWHETCRKTQQAKQRDNVWRFNIKVRTNIFCSVLYNWCFFIGNDLTDHHFKNHCSFWEEAGCKPEAGFKPFEIDSSIDLIHYELKQRACRAISLSEYFMFPRQMVNRQPHLGVKWDWARGCMDITQGHVNGLIFHNKKSHDSLVCSGAKAKGVEETAVVEVDLVDSMGWTSSVPPGVWKLWTMQQSQTGIK